MNIVFVSHCDFSGNSAMHIYSIANVLSELGLSCAVCVPNDSATIAQHGVPRFAVVPFDSAYGTGVDFPNGRPPDLIHAWTPRELVRKLTLKLAAQYGCPYAIHLEDNEDFILENELGVAAVDQMRIGRGGDVPEHRSHPSRSREFIAGAVGMTVLIDRLLEFKPSHIPGLVFWPGFDEEFLRVREDSAPGVRAKLGLDESEKILVYSGNIHDANAGEVRTLFLAVRALRRSGRRVTLLKTGWNYVSDPGWIREAIDSGAVRDLGFLPRPEMRAVAAAADILVQPGRPDRFNDYRFPSKLPEFFALGKPVVLPRTNVGLSVRDGVDALLLQYGNAIEIAEKVEALIDDPGLARRIGEAGRIFAKRRLSWSTNVPPLKDFYRDSVRQPALIAAVDEQPRLDFAAPAKLIAFYLPQFHPIPENDEFWGRGFTEWTNVTRAKPNFKGHDQPQLPADLGFYDLRTPEVLSQQAELARSYGIHGFCFYYYWFAGRRVLERPLDTMLSSGQPDFPFCICWANENWTRNWDGSAEEILIAQDYSEANCERFIRDVIPILRDPRYIRVGGAPMLLVYRVNLLPDPCGTARRWREICLEEGIGPIHLCAVQSFSLGDPRPYGFDAAVEFPPHTKRALIDPNTYPDVRPDFEGYLEDYPKIVTQQLELPRPDYPQYRGAMPAWDNTPRRGTRAHILVHSSPALFEEWLCTLIKGALETRQVQQPFVFINAWNEWAEGAYLEPDQNLGHARLKATLAALMRATDEHAASQAASPAFVPPPYSPSAVDPLWAAQTYASYKAGGLSYATVRDYCDSFDQLNGLATLNGDLKDVQRPWVLKAILSKLPARGRLLEIGAGEPIVADVLQRLGHEVVIVDPYDGSGFGPKDFDTYRERYPNLRFVRSFFDDRLKDIPEQSLDCIYSISVLEHIPGAALQGVFAGMKRYLKPTGVTIHAVDHVHRGNGAEEHLANLELMVESLGYGRDELDRLLQSMSEDIETYYLSAESHNRWRSGVPYDQFPMRVCVSIQIVADAARGHRVGLPWPVL